MTSTIVCNNCNKPLTYIEGNGHVCLDCYIRCPRCGMLKPHYLPHWRFWAPELREYVDYSSTLETDEDDFICSLCWAEMYTPERVKSMRRQRYALAQAEAQKRAWAEKYYAEHPEVLEYRINHLENGKEEEFIE